MPRTSKALAVLDDEVSALKAKHAALIAEQAAVEDAIERVKRMRVAMQTLPKRSGRAKGKRPATDEQATTPELLAKARAMQGA